MQHSTAKFAEETRQQTDNAVNLLTHQASPDAVRHLSPDLLRTHSRAAEIYGTFHEEADSLLESIRTEGVLNPLLVTVDGIVVAGNERLRVAHKLGITTVPVIVLGITSSNEIDKSSSSRTSRARKRTSSGSRNTKP